MRRTGVAVATGISFCTCVLLAADLAAEPGSIGSGWQDVDDAALAVQQFQADRPGAAVYQRDDRIRRVYGRAFSHAESPQASAEQFLTEHAEMFGVSRDELAERGRFADGRHVQPIMYEPETDSYRFTGLYYTQEVDGVPVFRSELMLLVRNEPDHPLVLASANLRDLGGFEVAGGGIDNVDPEVARAKLVEGLGREQAQQADFSDEEVVIWAGVEDIDVAQPRLAVKQTVEIGSPAEQPANYEKWLVLSDAQTGEELYRENLIIHGGVSGTVSANQTDGPGADICHGVHIQPMAYARVSGDGQVAYADEDGNFTLDNVGPGPVNVQSGVRGQYFRVFNQAGSDAILTEQAEPGESVEFVHNASNSSEQRLAEVNAYQHSNIVRDFTLQYNPDYPVIANQTEFEVNVNLNDNCNAFYNGSSINFFTSGGGCPNTGFSSVVYHEYGHHLIQTGGSGQGAYGEGMSDCIGVIITDDPVLGLGFSGSCSSGLRNADNDLQYPCSGGIHFCGQVLSGCVWDTRNELLQTKPDTYRDIISSLTINSILLHTGSSIDPSITIDFLTLDDDDGNILNGTPHYDEINAGFSAHNMPAPPLAPIDFIYPDGLPEIVAPGQFETFVVELEPLSDEPLPGSGMLHYRTGSSGPFTSVQMDEIEDDVYLAELPGADCGTPVEYYLSAESEGGVEQSSPIDAPEAVFAAISAAEITTAFADDFDADLGWTAGVPDDDATTGHWERANPNGTIINGEQVQPGEPFVGSAAYITGQHPGGGAGANDVDEGKTTLLSPVFDLSDVQDAAMSYQRWYSNHAGANPFNDIFVVDISDDGGDSWTNVETVGPAGEQVMGGWYHNEFIVSNYVATTDQVQLRFIASDYDPQALVEAAVDQFRVKTISCDTPIPGDLNGDGIVNGADLGALLSDWGPCDDPGECPADLNGDGSVDGADLGVLLSNWTD